jgi:hypothetical protein
MPQLTLLDIAKANGSDAVTGLIDESIKAHPELTIGASRTIRGLNYKTLVRTAAPTVAFRTFNAGTASLKSTFENRLVECYVLNPQIEADCAIADAYEDGAEAMLALEAGAILEGAMQTLATQFYYGTGTGGDALGFPGLIQAYDSTNMVVDAGGTTDSIASSAWAVCFGPKNVTWVWGNNGQLALSPVERVRILDGNSNPYMAYHQDILARPGLQVGSLYSVGRIKKLTTDSGKGLTDALIAELLSKFPAGVVPDAIFCNRRSLMQLQKSRTATNPTGAPAPFPADAFGIPIAVTDAILSTETLAL